MVRCVWDPVGIRLSTFRPTATSRLRALYRKTPVGRSSAISTVDGREVLGRVRELPIASWNYKFDDPSIRHLGPVAEDFHGAFALGASERQISSLDTSGVALAAIQGLSELVDEKDARISRLEKANEEMAARLEALEKALASPK